MFSFLSFWNTWKSWTLNGIVKYHEQVSIGLIIAKYIQLQSNIFGFVSKQCKSEQIDMKHCRKTTSHEGKQNATE
jgi:hypothetical protein